MPDIPKYPAFQVTSNLQSQLTFNQTAGVADPLAGTGATIPTSLNVQQVSQNSDGTWNEVLSTQPSPVSSQTSLTSQIDQRRDDTIAGYEDLASVYDSEMLRFNDQINSKKSEIVTLISTAIGAGCSFKVPTGPVSVSSTIPFVAGAEDVDGVAIGIGSIVQSDQVNIKVYSNITNYSANSPFDPKTTETLTTSNLGNGYENEVSNNSGTVLSSSYRYISPNSADHIGTLLNPLTPAEQVICAGYGSSIIQIAAQIEDIRDERDQFLDQVNNLKNLKTKQEILKWGNSQGDTALSSYNTQLQNAIVSVSQYIDNIVIDGLIVHYDAGQNYGIEASVQNTTNINAVSKWNNLVGDGLYASPQTSLYQINLDTADGPSVELNNYPTATNQYFTVDNSFIESGKIGTGSTSYTIETWVKVTNDVALGISSTTNGANLVGISSVHGYGLQVYKPSGIRLSFGERGNGRLTNSTNLATNTWYHVVATNEASVGSKIYLNGTLDASGSAINITSSVSNLQIGYASAQINQYFSGKVAIVRIYNKSLNQTEVTKNYDAHKSRFGY